jgi:hypothetical protein
MFGFPAIPGRFKVYQWKKKTTRATNIPKDKPVVQMVKAKTLKIIKDSYGNKEV